MDRDTRELVRQAAEYIVRKEYRVSDIFRKRLYEKDERFAFLSPRRSHHERVVKELEEAVQRMLGTKRKHKLEQQEHTKDTKYRKTVESQVDYRDRLATVPMGILASYMRNHHVERKPYEVLDVEEILNATPLSPVSWSSASSELRDKVESFYSLL